MRTNDIFLLYLKGIGRVHLFMNVASVGNHLIKELEKKR